ncbi:class II fructose-bisphosphate aldolase [Streptomyces sp. NPDC015414]|uniref:class II fructose-bisphosphate aldolase n=1 Tax=Streptomyces sp. NPDC015414 TaxID=3364957 RepID=UPI0036FC34D3
MRAQWTDLLRPQTRPRSALACFTCYDVNTASGVVTAAEEADEPVCLLVSDAMFRGPAGPQLTISLVAVAARAAVPCVVQLDHCTDLDTIAAALELGVDAVMADGSRLPLEENTRLVADALAMAERYGAGVEAELGRVEGDEDRDVAARAGGYTDPVEAVDFVKRSGAHCLAVSVGNVHGSYTGTPSLDWGLLERLTGDVPVPLSLHGTSGLPTAQVQRAIATGVRKYNVNTEIRRSQFAVLHRELAVTSRGFRVQELGEHLWQAAYQVARDTAFARRG